MASLWKLFVSIAGENTEYKRAIRDSIQEGDRFGASTQALSATTVASFERITSAASKLTGIGTALTAAITVPLVGFGVAALKTAGEMEQNTISFKTMMGSAEAAGKHLQALKDFALKTPFGFNDLVLASKRMQALGFEARDVVPMLHVVGDAAAGLGMGAEGIQRIVTALGQMKAKGMVQAEEMRQLAEAGIPAWQTLAKTLGTDVAGAMKAVEKRTVEASVAIPAILAGMNAKFGGLMSQQSKSLLGQWEQVKEQIKFTLIEVGNVLMPIAKAMMEKAIIPMLGLVKSLASAFAQLPGPVQSAAFAFTGFMGIAGPALVILGSLAGAVKSLRDAYLMFAAAQTAQVIPALVASRTATLAAGASTYALGGTFTAFGATATTATTAATAGVVSLQAALGGIVMVLGAIYAGYVAVKNIKDTAGLDAKGNSKPGFIFTGFGGIMAPQSTPAPSTESVPDLPVGSSESRSLHRLLNPPAAKETASAIAEVADKLRAIPFTEKSLEGAVLVGIYEKQSAELRKYVQAVVDAGGVTEYYDKQVRSVAASLTDMPTAIFPQTDIAKLTKDLKEFGVSLDPVAPEVGKIEAAMRSLGITSTDVLREQYEAALAAARAMAENGASVNDVGAAMERVAEAHAKLSKRTTDWTKATGEARKETNEFQKQIDRSFNRLAHGIADSIVNWKGFGATLKEIAKDTATSFLEIMIRQLIKPLEEQFAKLAGALGKALGIGGGAASSAASGAASAAGGASSAASGAGSVAAGASSGVMGAITMVSGIATAVSSVVGNFQMAGMNKSLDVLVNHTLRIYNELAQFRADAWTREAHWYARTSDMWQSIIDVKDAITRGGGGAGRGGINFTNCSFTGSPNEIASAIFTQAQLAGAI
jgi:tape measure domain-containing protein